jgi:hypothetical protein
MTYRYERNGFCCCLILLLKRGFSSLVICDTFAEANHAPSTLARWGNIAFNFLWWIKRLMHGEIGSRVEPDRGCGTKCVRAEGADLADSLSRRDALAIPEQADI